MIGRCLKRVVQGLIGGWRHEGCSWSGEGGGVLLLLEQLLLLLVVLVVVERLLLLLLLLLLVLLWRLTLLWLDKRVLILIPRRMRGGHAQQACVQLKLILRIGQQVGVGGEGVEGRRHWIEVPLEWARQAQVRRWHREE